MYDLHLTLLQHLGLPHRSVCRKSFAVVAVSGMALATSPVHQQTNQPCNNSVKKPGASAMPLTKKKMTKQNTASAYLIALFL